MKRKFVYVFICTALIFSLISCNLPISSTGDSADLELTITAQALIIEQAGQSPTPSQTPIVIVITATPDESGGTAPQATATETPSQINAPTFTLTPTSNLLSTGTPTVTVSVATNCRKGPGQTYESVYGLPIGQSAEVVGKNTSTNYWIIKIPGSNNTCWLWGQYATVTGDTSSLQTVQIPPTPTSTATKVVLQPPVAPSNLIEQNTCTLNTGGGFTYITAGTVTWQDNSNNENGFNIYWRAGFASGATDVLIGTVGPNVTSYGFGNQQTNSDMANSVKVEAFNNIGVSNRASVNIVLNCPPKP